MSSLETIYFKSLDELVNMQRLLLETKSIDEMHNINFNTRLYTANSGYSSIKQRKFNPELKRGMVLLQRLEVHCVYITELHDFMCQQYNQRPLELSYERIKRIHEEAQDIYAEIKETKEYLESEYDNYIGGNGNGFSPMKF